MRFDERTLNELKEIRIKLANLILKYSDVKSEEYDLLRRLHIILDGGISLSEKDCVLFSINSGELEKFKANAKADGLSPDEIVEDLICEYNKRG